MPGGRFGRNWVVRKADEGECRVLGQEADLSRLGAVILHHRGVRSPEEAGRFLNASLQDLSPPSLFDDMDKAVERIHQALVGQEKVLVYGDYDVDGLTGTAVLVLFLRSLGLDPVYHVPDRLREGYGFHREPLPGFRKDGVRLIITVDCGISAVEEVDEARRLGIDVIVTDHHECAGALPRALAVLNPKVPGSGFPFRELAGVGVVFYLVIALRKRLRDGGQWQGSGLAEPNLLAYLDLVSLGTLADMVPLRRENRIFVKFGLEEISRGRRPGIQMLKQQAGIQGEVRHSQPVVFRMIPRINAPGRLGCSGDSLHVLLSEDEGEARRFSVKLEERNRERREIEARVCSQALDMARRGSAGDRAAIVLAADGWHRGILGIVAARVASEFRLPAALISFEADEGRGSVRGVEGLEVLDAVVSCRSLLERFGGHPMAAGFAVKRENLDAFRERFEGEFRRKVGQARDRRTDLALDAWVDDPQDLDERFWEDLRRIGPFGYGNEEPVLGMRGVRVAKLDVVGGNHLRMLLEFGAARLPSIGFGMGRAAATVGNGPSHWNVAFVPQQEIWKGRRMTSLRIVDMQPA